MCGADRITFTNDGQIDGTYSELPKEQLQTQEKLDEEAKANDNLHNSE